MSDKTIQEIQAEFSSSLAKVMSGYQGKLQEIKNQREIEAGAYLDRLTSEQRMSLLREQKMERANQLTERTREAYSAEVERYHAGLRKRTQHLQGRLFGVEDAGALNRPQWQAMMSLRAC